MLQTLAKHIEDIDVSITVIPIHANRTNDNDTVRAYALTQARRNRVDRVYVQKRCGSVLTSSNALNKKAG